MKPTEDIFQCQSAAYIEGLLADYLRDPDSVDPAWKEYFQQIGEGKSNGNLRLGPSYPARSLFHPPPRSALQGPAETHGGAGNGSSPPRTRGLEAPAATPMDAARLDAARLQDRVDQLIRAYRVRGHLAAKIDPLGFVRPRPVELDPAFHRLTEEDLQQSCSTIAIGGPATQTLRSIIKRLETTYCRAIGAQFMHIDDLSVRDWLQQRMEERENRIQLTRREQIRILTRLTDAVMFEEFVRKKHVGAKTFSLEGAESLIPLLDLAIEKAGRQGVNEIVMGMAHRGRLNVLANIMSKRPVNIFWEFRDANPRLYRGRGDVKYHLGHSSGWTTAEGHEIHLSLCFNPSHLEYVNPVAVGRARAKQDRQSDSRRDQVMTLLIHGDAAFAGEGVVQETLNLSQLRAYRTGGTLHVVVNNQVGFTTSPEEGRSSTYATDVARMLQIPIFHVNGEDPEAVAQVVDLAMDFRQKFSRDVVIDMYCFRRWGHNEGDEPSFTQPQLYAAIEHRDTVRYEYLQRLLLLGEITVEEAEKISQERHDHLEKEFELAHSGNYRPQPQSLGGVWAGYCGGEEPADDDPPTGVDREQLCQWLEKLTQFPDDFHLHRKLQRSMEKRRDMARGRSPLDWSAAEALAFATLATEGHRVRLTGQDAERGTFSHRHAVLHDAVDGHKFMPLQHLDPDQAPVEIANSPLSEAGVLGFEYGYSLDWPEALVAWEAQFGDFWNCAQVIVDQFIVSAEDKWRRLSGLVMLLPHGFEGQGPEHSSARLERFLLLAAEDNIQIVSPTTPAQMFHVMRRQVKRKWRKPLVVLTPKSLLRHPRVVSSLEELEAGHFRRVLPDQGGPRPEEAHRVLLCGGKVYYDLLQARDDWERDDVAILRLEQYYPLPESQLRAILAPYGEGTHVTWVQEEPENMGAWRYLKVRFGESIFGEYPFSGVFRPPSASPATGSSQSHKLEQQDLIDAAFSD
jgi:2-oxoglutarate dehydrogenase E1 component